MARRDERGFVIPAPPDQDRQWLRLSKAVRILHRILKNRLAGQEPAPWISPPADPFDAECEHAAHRHRRTARTSVTMRRALLSGDLTVHLVNDGRSNPLPGWVWKNASAAENAFNFNWLPLNPLLDHGLHDFGEWRCFVPRAEFKAWIADSHVAETGDLPTLPAPFDQNLQPDEHSYREPPEKPFIELTQALTWIAFAVSLSRNESSFMESCRFGPFAQDGWPDALSAAMAGFADQASAGNIRVRGRYVANYSDHSAAAQADTEYLSDTQLRDFACFDSLYGGLERGAGLGWETDVLERALEARGDGWRDVEVCREDLLKYFRGRIDPNRVLREPLPASLPSIGAVMGLEEALCWLAFDRPSHDLLIWQNAAGDWLFRDSAGAVIHLAEDRPLPDVVARHFGGRKAATIALRSAMEDGTLGSYVAGEDGRPFAIPRANWRWGPPDYLTQFYQGISGEEKGSGCPVLLSRPEFNAWREAIARSPKPLEQAKPTTARKRPGPAPDPDWPHAIKKVTQDCIAAGYKRPLKRGDKAAIQTMLLSFMAEKDKHFSDDIAAKHAEGVIEALPDN